MVPDQLVVGGEGGDGGHPDEPGDGSHPDEPGDSSHPDELGDASSNESVSDNPVVFPSPPLPTLNTPLNTPNQTVVLVSDAVSMTQTSSVSPASPPAATSPAVASTASRVSDGRALSLGDGSSSTVSPLPIG